MSAEVETAAFSGVNPFPSSKGVQDMRLHVLYAAQLGVSNRTNWANGKKSGSFRGTEKRTAVTFSDSSICRSSQMNSLTNHSWYYKNVLFSWFRMLSAAHLQIILKVLRATKNPS